MTIYYSYKETYPDAYILLRPDGTKIGFLQGDDARQFEREVNKVKQISRYPYGVLKSQEQAISYLVDNYDYEKWADAEIVAQGNYESKHNIF